jgi:hypothetical protein
LSRDTQRETHIQLPEHLPAKGSATGEKNQRQGHDSTGQEGVP